MTSKQITKVVVHFFCLTVCFARKDLLSPSTLFVMDLVITLLALVMMDMFLILPPVLSMLPTCWFAPQSRSSLTSSGQDSLDA